MKIALIADVHDQMDALTWFFDDIARHHVSYIFGLGDYSSSPVIERCANINMPLFAVFGNCDLQKDAMRRIAKNAPHVQFSPNDHEGEIIVAQKRFFLTHFPERAARAAESLSYDAVFHGHTHHARCERIGTTPVINPGKFVPYPHATVSYGIYDTTNGSCTIIEKT